jgi:hypothetical protein
MDKLFAEISSVQDEITTLKGDQGRLTIAVNCLQSDKHKPETFVGDKGKTDPPLPLPLPTQPTHKLRFVKYDGAEDPIGWIHKCEQFFRANRTPKDEKVLTVSYYLEGPAQQWYFRPKRNRGMPTWPQFVDFVNRRLGPPVRSNPWVS